jgi:hypothetical protein
MFVFQDEGLGGNLLKKETVPLPATPCTLREMLIARIQAEVHAYNAEACGTFLSLVQPREAEATLRGFQLPIGALIDEETQTYLSLAAFQEEAFMVFVDGRAVKELNQVALVQENSVVRCVHLQNPWPLKANRSLTADFFS